MADHVDLLRSNLVPVIFGTLFGALVTFVVTKLANKSVRLRYSSVVERIAVSANDQVFGTVQVTWNGGQPMRNLYLATIEVENTSSRDFENVDLKVYCGDDTELMSERTSVAGNPYIVEWSPSYKAMMAIPAGGAPSQWQLYNYMHGREYEVPVFNRGQLLHLNYLCTRPNDDQTPALWVSTRLKGARLALQVRRNFTHGVPQQIALAHGLVIAFLTACACSFFIHTSRTASFVCIAVGLFAQSFGALEYKIWKWLWKLLAG